MEAQTNEQPGQRLGGYELLELIGSGAIGDVYRARSSASGQEVALKVMRDTEAGRHELHRFRHEATTLKLLSHPNIVLVHDVGTDGNTPYIATELLEGETLRDRLKRGTLAPRTATLIAIQVADGLAAAHQKGIVHRDLKPENLFITRHNSVKILDFGLAKLLCTPPPTATQLSSTVSATRPGVLLGTLSYMSPEQINGDPDMDHRTDIFSLGVVIYEMLTGLRPFQKDSPGETVAAVLHADPPDLAAVRADVPPELQQVVRDCLEKDPTARFDSARDVALALRAVLKGLEAPQRRETYASDRAKVRMSRRAVLLVLLILALAAGTTAVIRTLRGAREDPARFTRISFGAGAVFTARSTSDGRTIYEAAVNGNAPELFITVPGTAESRRLGIAGAVLSISSSRQVAISENPRTVRGYLRVGTLAIGVLDDVLNPRRVLENVYWAEFNPRSDDLAVVRDAEGRMRLELLGGRTLYETGGWLGEPRYSPDGTMIAFADHPLLATPEGSIVVIDADGRSRVLSSGWTSLLGLAWAPDGREIFFTGHRGGDRSVLHAVNLDGRVRVVRHAAGRLRLHDVAPDGRLLLSRDDVRLEAWGAVVGDQQERNLTWLGWTMPRDFSADGSILVFSEAGEAAGSDGAAYLRDLKTSKVTLLGRGSAQALSPDGRQVLSLIGEEFVLQPTGAGQTTPLGNDGISHNPWAGFFPDGQRIVFAGSEAPRGSRVYVQQPFRGKPVPITPEGFRLSSANVVSPDGKMVAAIGPDERVYLCPVDGGHPQLLIGSKPGDLFAAWQPNGSAVLLFTPSELPVKMYRVELGGKRELWKVLSPRDLTGAVTVHRVVVAQGGRAYAYTLERMLSDLYLAAGLR